VVNRRQECDWSLAIKSDKTVKMFTRQEEQDLFALARAGDEDAKLSLLKSQWPMVIKQANQYAWTGADMDDMISCGMTGLIKAYEKFDTKRGTRFTTCATWWIRQAIAPFARRCQYSCTIPTTFDFGTRQARRAGVSPDKYMKDLRFRFSRNTTIDNVSRDHQSFKVRDECRDAMESSEKVRVMRAAIEQLDSRQQKIMGMHLDGKDGSVIARKTGITRQAVSQQLATCRNKIALWIKENYPEFAE
jgi:RNA polymerase sigma factor (sigma-70 family)